MSFDSPGSFFNGSYTKDRADELAAVREKKRAAEAAKAETISLPVLGTRSPEPAREERASGRESGFQPGVFQQRAVEKAAERREEREQKRREESLSQQQDAVRETRRQLAELAKADAGAFAAAIGQFRAMMEVCFPDLVALTTQQQIPTSSSLFPVAACLGGDGPCWMHPIPEGDKDGAALVWSKDDHAWLPGEVVGGAYDGEFALYMNGTKLMVKEGHVCVNGMFNNSPCYVPNTMVVDTENLSNNAFVHVYLCAYQAITQNNENTPVREVRTGIPARFVALVETSNTHEGVRGYIDLGEYTKGGGIKQNYLGGSGSQIVVGIAPSGDNKVLKWNQNTETWQAEYLSPIA